MNLVDARGQVCPVPLVMVKKQFLGLATGGDMTVLIDNETSKQNVERFLTDNGAAVSTSHDAGVWRLTVRKAAGDLPHPDERAYCATPSTGAPHTICIKNDRMGFGVDELGGILIRAFVNTIKETTPLPGTIVFYNNGIFLALKDSPVIGSLRELEGRGVRILTCGTCLDYHKKKQDLGVGIVSNMYDISQVLASASHVVYP